MKEPRNPGPAFVPVVVGDPQIFKSDAPECGGLSRTAGSPGLILQGRGFDSPPNRLKEGETRLTYTEFSFCRPVVIKIFKTPQVTRTPSDVAKMPK